LRNYLGDHRATPLKITQNPRVSNIVGRKKKLGPEGLKRGPCYLSKDIRSWLASID